MFFAGNIDISKLNILGRGDHLEKSVRYVELPMGKVHLIRKIKKRTSRYGPALLVSIPDDICFFMPSRLSEPLLETPGALAEMNELINQQALGIQYNGGAKKELQFVQLKNNSQTM